MDISYEVVPFVGVSKFIFRLYVSFIDRSVALRGADTICRSLLRVNE